MKNSPSQFSSPLNKENRCLGSKHKLRTSLPFFIPPILEENENDRSGKQDESEYDENDKENKYSKKLIEQKESLQPHILRMDSSSTSAGSLTGQSTEEKPLTISHEKKKVSQHNPITSSSFIHHKGLSSSPILQNNGPNGRSTKRYGTFVAEDVMKSSPSMKMLISQSTVSKSTDLSVNLKFLEKEEWSGDKKCFVCTRPFKKMNGVFEHHCRACGSAICGECSSSKINNNRVCDVCFYKANNARADQRRKDQLGSKNLSIKTYKRQLIKEKDDFEDIHQKKLEMEDKIKVENEEQKKILDQLNTEKNKAEDTFNKKKDMNIKLKESLAVDKNFLKEKEIEYEELKNKINSLKLQVSQKRKNLEAKQQEFSRLYYQIRKYEESASFLNLVPKGQTKTRTAINYEDNSSTSIIFDLKEKH